MSAHLGTRKPILKLKAADLRAFPIWEYAVDEEGDGEMDETWVRPVEATAVPKGAYSQIVATDFLTVAGRKLQGFVIVSTANGKVEIDPGAIVGRIGYRALPRMSRKAAMTQKATWDVALRERFLAAMRLADNEVFPLHGCLRVVIRGEKTPRECVLR
jgi:hypothetical protein